MPTPAPCLWVLAPVGSRVFSDGLKSSSSPLDASPHFITCTDFGLHPVHHSGPTEGIRNRAYSHPRDSDLPQLNAGANTRAAFGWIRESASQRHPDKRLRRVVLRAASLLGVGLHAAKRSGGRGESERAGGGGAPTKPRHSRGRSPIFPVSRPSFFPGLPRVSYDPYVHVAVAHMDRAHTHSNPENKQDGLEPGDMGATAASLKW